MWLMLSVALAHAADTAVWTSAIFIHDLAPERRERLKGWADLHVRRSGASSLGLARGAVGYPLAEGLTVWGGHAWIATLPDEGNFSSEQRPWQQVLWNVDLAGGQAQLRVREEQRLQMGHPGVAHRSRALVRYTRPLAEPSWSLIGWNEVFYQWNDPGWAGYQGLDQNRSFLGFGLKGAAAGTRVEMGWLGVAVWRPTRTLYTHAASVNLVWTS